jgi:hypothetical protein
MRKGLMLFALISCFSIRLQSQTNTVAKKEASKKARLAVSTFINLPIGIFAETHFAGAGFEVTKANTLLPKPNNKISFSYNGGFDYFIGNKESTSNYSYKYPGYTVIHLAAGVQYLSHARLSIGMHGGPGLSIYNGNTRFCIVGKIATRFDAKKKISLLAGLKMNSEFTTRNLWNLFAGVSFKL